MNENLNLVEILEGCPKGTKFYSSNYGEVAFVGVIDNDYYPIKLIYYTKIDKVSAIAYVTKEGYSERDSNGECILFPSKDQRDWSKFERFWAKPKVEKFDPKTFQPFDKVLSKYYIDREWTCGILSHPYCHSGFNGFIVNSNLVRYCIPYNEETKHLVGTKEDCPEYYKWWEE